MLEQKVIKNLKTTLLAKKGELNKKLNAIAIVDEDDKWEPRYVDRAREDDVNANEVEDFTNEAGVVALLSKDLKDVKIALQKMDSDTYGKCEVCDIDIPVERLKAFPEARTCTKCILPK
jgi:RNA polymerase-binding transcription factor DksA